MSVSFSFFFGFFSISSEDLVGNARKWQLEKACGQLSNMSDKPQTAAAFRRPRLSIPPLPPPLPTTTTTTTTPTKKRTKAHAKCREETLGIREKEEEENNNYARQLFSIFNECDVKPHHQLISSSFFLFPPLFPPPTEGERKKRKKKSNKTRKPQKHGVGSRQSCVLLCCV
jgi:hypothetical protein